MNKSDIRLIKLTLALIWLGTAFVVIFCYPIKSSLELVSRTGLSGDLAYFALIAGIVVDVLFGFSCLLFDKKWFWRLQMAVTVIYTIIITLYLPEFWLHPFSPILKNIAILMLLRLMDKYGQESA